MAGSNNEQGVDVAALIEDDKNRTKIVCQLCSSVILLPGKAAYVSKEFPLPHMKKKKEGTDVADAEELSDYWVVDDMFTFENVGFSNTVGMIKYLTCADCEIGPVGWHDLNNKKAYYISLTRVQHVQ
ncbi:guanine nucleotide exchange factor MSS4-like [Liolophura sinensis]|uniref:guanine nucleotide exchange factor MSS4-like n=1 Tax=Liolophura sinensis TaxID=3198878 RepID=UPI00315900C2